MTSSAFAIVSLVFCVGGMIVLLASRRRTGMFRWSGFVFVMIVSVFLYDMATWDMADGEQPLVASVFASAFDVVQTLTANRDLVQVPSGGLPSWLGLVADLYGIILFILAPVSIVTAALDYFSDLLSSLRLRVVSWFCDSYVLSHLDARTIDLAQDLRREAKEAGRSVCIAFAGCAGMEDELLAKARRLKAICLDGDVDIVWTRCAFHRSCSIVLLEDDEEAAISLARKINDEVRERARCRRGPLGGGETRVFVLTDFRDTEPLLFPEVLQSEEAQAKQHDAGGREPHRIQVRGIDLTRELVEHVILRYPLFLLSRPLPGVSVSRGVSWDEQRDRSVLSSDDVWYGVDSAEVAARRRRELYERADRHLLVVGAGSVGSEFLSSALWASRIDGIRTRIDVIDAVEDPLRPGMTLAEDRFSAAAPGIMSHLEEEGSTGGEERYDLHFSLVDATTDGYDLLLHEHANTLTYVFVALGDDLLNARVAMHTRQVLERELAWRSDAREDFVVASRPLIVAVIHDDGFAATVERAENEGQPYDIVCVGNDSDILTSRMLDSIASERVTEYKRRSSRANDTHSKYRLFAFARNLALDRYHLRSVCADDLAGLGVESLLDEVDWRVDLGEPSEREQAAEWGLTRLYNRYCTDELTKSLARNAPADKPSREWLLRMEHDRWCAYVLTQGFDVADLDTVRRIFATGQTDKEKHRSNLMGLHPCLVGFDELAELDDPVRELYEAYFEALDEHEAGLDESLRERRRSISREEDKFQLLDDGYIGIS